MDTTTALAVAIGGRVKRHRQARRWTLDQLAAAAGVSRRLVVNVEQGAANPSVGTLLKLGDALGVGLPSLVAPAEPRPVRVTRCGDGATLWSSHAGGRAVLVAAAQGPDAVELWDWTLAPDDRHDSDPHAPGTAELLRVHRGRVVVEVAGESVTLGAGDAASFAGDVAHSYANVGRSPASFTLAVCEPGVVSKPRSEAADV